MINETVLSRSIRLMFVGGIALGMQLANAQEAPASDAPLQKVEVTGSRIPSLNTEGASPITQMTAKDIAISGVQNTEDLLNSMPQVFADQGSALSNGASGTSTVALRGLGADRTLVLVNGKRLPSGSVNDSAADLNEIPAQLIQRVDILTGGAGAVYGAGAVAGVVNFILKDNFQGVEVSGNYNGFNHDQHSPIGSVVSKAGYPVPGDIGLDGKTKDISVLMGSNFDDNKGNATLFFSYKEQAPILQSSRDFTACALGSSSKGFSCSGSGTAAGGSVVNNDTGVKYTNDGSGGARLYGATDAYNFGPLNYLQRPSQQYNFHAQAHYDINDKVRVYEEFSFHNYTTNAQIAPGGIFGVQATLSVDNPLLSQSWKDALGLSAANPTQSVTIAKRNVEGGPRVDSINDNSFREVLGAKGDIDNFNYDVFAQFARVSHQETSSGYFSAAKIGNALDVVTDPATGLPACRVAVSGADTACVPYNLYKTGGITQAALNYLQVSGLIQGYTQQIVYGGSVGADLTKYGAKSPWASNGAGVSFGLEHRSEKLVFNPDEETASGDLSGGSGSQPALSGSYSVKEAFGEFHLPIADKKAFIDSLDLSGSYRHSEYSTDTTTNTYGLGLEWAPAKIVRFRGSYQRAVRAPTIQDLYNPTSVGLGGPNNDPCAGNAPTASLAECERTGLTAAQYGHTQSNSANQYQSQTGGNTEVKPEVADTYTLGLVLTPIKDLVLTLDAFEIDIKNTISTVDPTVALTQCLQTGNPVFCNLIHRDSLGSLFVTTNGYISNQTTNIGNQNTNGVDLGVNYRYRMKSMGALDFTLNGTLLGKLTTTNVPGMGSYDCKGLFGATCGTPNPEWRHKFRTTWSTPWQFDVSGTWRYFSPVKNDATSGNSLLSGEVAPIESQFASRSYFDLNVSYPLSKHVSISGGVNNLFDKDPPIASTNATTAAGSANGNTYPQVYDANGRLIYVNVTAKF